MPSARDSEKAQIPVVGASGAAAFDGNHTGDVQAWLIPNDDWDPDLAPVMIDQLMDWAISGHLAWVVFPPNGFRL